MIINCDCYEQKYKNIPYTHSLHPDISWSGSLDWPDRRGIALLVDYVINHDY